MGARPPWEDPAWRDQVKHSAQDIWAAGMAAFAKAQSEGGKVFEAMVQEGMALQRKTQQAAESGLQQAAQRLGAVAEEVVQGVGHTAGPSWDRLETLFEGRTAKALARLGVPSAQELEALRERLSRLETRLDQLQAAGEPPAAAAPAPGRKRAAAAAPGRQRAQPR